MHKIAAGLIAGLWVMALAAGWAEDVVVDWAYHDDADGIEDRLTEMIPGEGYAFVGNGSLKIPDGDTVYLYVLTANNFAGDKEEQLFVRWWDGEKAHWIMGQWMKNVYLGTGDEASVFHGQPQNAPVMLDLWKFEVPADLTRPGQNYYAFQLKGWRDGEPVEKYLVRETAGDFSGINNLGQAWSASEDFSGRDWIVEITP